MEEKFLPIGSVVRLKGATDCIMITGYLAIREVEPDVVYSYSGCAYPQGFIGKNYTLMFNHDQIEEVCFKGYVTEEQQVYNRHVNDIASQLHTMVRK